MVIVYNTACIPGVPRVKIAKGKANLFLEGNPVVYAGAVESVQGNPAAGQGVIVTDWQDCAIAWGIYNPHSMFRVRILQLDRTVRKDASAALYVKAALKLAISQAVALRRALGLPREDTTVYRLINSEGDGCSGLVVDVVGSVAIAVPSASWLLSHLDLIEKYVVREAGVESLVWRFDKAMLQLEGAEESVLDILAAQRSPQGDEGQPQQIAAVEGGVRYLVDPMGQKTGFYADQRESRAFLASVAEGKHVLDLCCYTGAFALNAAVAGAASAVGIDSSQAAIDLATANAALNGVAQRCARLGACALRVFHVHAAHACATGPSAAGALQRWLLAPCNVGRCCRRCTFACQGVEEFMRDAILQNKLYDIVVLDPPKLAPTKKVLPQATNKYLSLNTAALRLVRPGGMLMTCSCSSAMTLGGGFQAMLVKASRKARCSITILRSSGAAADHVLNPSFPEGQYLTNVTVAVT
jgi:23S rRNA G2069 N7-methylase RlmK/C1962 C5-methylase RlmI